MTSIAATSKTSIAATLKTSIKHKLLSVQEKLDLINTVDAT
jgi:hypothetical protein